VARKNSIILTSATLTAAGEFDYLRSRLFAETADELALGSPFDFENAAMLYMINDIPSRVIEMATSVLWRAGLIQLAQATGGRMLVLFTSYDQLKRTSQAIVPCWQNTISGCTNKGKALRLTVYWIRSEALSGQCFWGQGLFWEGVDVPGEALSVLAIIKLPFDVPSDPIVAARSETFEDPFNHILFQRPSCASARVLAG